MNTVLLIGRLVKDPELRYTQSNIPVTTFTLAVNRTASEETDFINIVVWRKQAENCSKYIKKGSQVAIEGSIQTRSYEDKNGQKRHITEVVADNVKFLDTKNRVQQEINEFNNSSINTLENLNIFLTSASPKIFSVYSGSNLPFIAASISSTAL